MDPNNPWNQPILTRPASAGFYDERAPRLAHPNVQAPPNPYGPNFQDIAQGRCETFHGQIPPVLPNPWVKTPQPFTPNVQADYNHYKGHLTQAAAQANRHLNDHVRLGYPQVPEDRLKWCGGNSKRATAARNAANDLGAARAGFVHKYPAAFDNLVARENHFSQGLTTMRRSKVPHWKTEENKAEEKLAQQQQQQQPQFQPPY